jgi:Methionyl-tRNA synthetase
VIAPSLWGSLQTWRGGLQFSILLMWHWKEFGVLFLPLNKYNDEQAPWKLRKTEPERMQNSIIYTSGDDTLYWYIASTCYASLC